MCIPTGLKWLDAEFTEQQKVIQLVIFLEEDGGEKKKPDVAELDGNKLPEEHV